MQLATSSKLPPFAPHLTLGPAFQSSQRDAVAKCHAAADRIAGHFECCPTGDVGRAVDNPFRTLAVEIVKSEPLTAAYTAAAAALGEAGVRFRWLLTRPRPLLACAFSPLSSCELLCVGVARAPSPLMAVPVCLEPHA